MLMTPIAIAFQKFCNELCFITVVSKGLLSFHSYHWLIFFSLSVCSLLMALSLLSCFGTDFLALPLSPEESSRVIVHLISTQEVLLTPDNCIVQNSGSGPHGKACKFHFTKCKMKTLFPDYKTIKNKLMRVIVIQLPKEKH